MPLPNGPIGVNNSPLLSSPFVESWYLPEILYYNLVDQNNVAVVNQDNEEIIFPVNTLL